MTKNWETKVVTNITKDDITKAEQCLIANGIDKDEVEIVLQAIGYILLDEELYSQKHRKETCYENHTRILKRMRQKQSN